MGTGRSEGVEPALEAARRSGLIRAGEPLLVLVSGGADSVCLLDLAVRLEARASALHVNYGLRSEASADEALCSELADQLGVPLVVEHADLAVGRLAERHAPGRASADSSDDEPKERGRGNLQAEARAVRYAHAERHAEGDYAAAHTASDQAETVLYRLAVSPGRRPLLAMAPRRGRLVRPLLEARAEDTRAYCRARGLAWREDPSNSDRRFARSRIRHEVLPALKALNPRTESTIAETSRLLREEAEVLEQAVDVVLDGVTGAGVALSELRKQPRALARLVLRRLAEDATQETRSISREDAESVLALDAAGGSRSLDLGGGLRAIAEYGTVRFSTTPDAPPPDPVPLAIPGTARFGPWEVEARMGRGGEAVLSAPSLGSLVTVRAWSAGDRMRPAGVGGTKSLQDLFTDRKVPRALRRSLPIVEVRGDIAWVAGVAVGEQFRAPSTVSADEECRDLVSLSARRTAS